MQTIKISIPKIYYSNHTRFLEHKNNQISMGLCPTNKAASDYGFVNLNGKTLCLRSSAYIRTKFKLICSYIIYSIFVSTDTAVIRINVVLRSRFSLQPDIPLSFDLLY
jgi:hypothetical protein